MKKFNFSLEKVLRLREFEEKEAKIDLGKAIAEGDRLKLELENVAQERVQANRMRTSNATVSDLVTIDNYCMRLDLLKEQLIEEIAQAEIIIENKRKVFSEKMKNRKVLSKLKEKKIVQWKKEVLDAEEKVIDDVVTAKYNS
ncbi:MAG: flagellar export protein FliJ [Treponema sp.]|jgi:flagellar FliJ protein|nr:flagellar export protein FliJ [Treponema sp.]